MSALVRSGLMIINLLFLIHSSLAAMEPYPLGFHFGARHVTAAYVAANGQQVLVAAVYGGDKYAALIRDSVENQGCKIMLFGQQYVKKNDDLVPVPEDPIENPLVEEVFEEALKRLKARVEHEEGDIRLNLTSVSVPQHFNDTLYIYANRAILRSEPHMIRPWQVRRSYNAVRMAYNLNTCDGFGVDTKSCREGDDDFHHVFFIDLNDDYLELGVAEVGELHLVEEAREVLRHLGANRMSNEHNEYGSYQEQVNETLRSFVDKSLHAQEHRHRLDTLRAVVLSGDAPPKAIAYLKESVKSILPEADLKSNIVPLYVGAVGAAEWARLQAQNPHLLDDIQVSTRDEL